MKIVQVQTQAEAGGAQRVSDLVAAGLRARGHDVRTVFLYRKTPVYDADPFADFIAHDIPTNFLARLRAAVGLLGYMRRVRPDAVFSYQHFGNVIGTVAGRLAGVGHLVANQSGAPLRGGLRGIATWVDKVMGTMGFYHHSVVNSGWTAAQFARYPQRYRTRVRRIDHGVARPSRQYDKGRARIEYSLPADAKIIITTGRLNPLKNHVVLVEALRHLPDLHLAIAGEGPERQRLIERAKELGVAARLHLVGEVAPENIYEFLACGDVYVFPSLQETFGLAPVEAAISGLPVIASDLDVLKEVLATEEGEPAAVFVPPEDERALASAIENLLGNPELERRLIKAGGQLAAKYAPERMCLAYEHLIST